MENSLSFGTLIGNAPPPPSGKELRIAILGDFSGRANRGELDDGDELAERKPIKIEFDTIDDVLEDMEPQLVIPLAGGASTVELEFSELDAFDADELFEQVDLLEEVQGISRRIERSVEKAAGWINGWSEADGDVGPPSGRSRGVAVPAAETLEELGSLTGEASADDDGGASSDALEALCGPILCGPAGEDDPSKEELLAAAAECTNAAARAVLHHPDFQALEGIWRELEWLLRRVDKGGRVKVLLFDVTAEEFAADLASGDELAETGLYRLLVEKVAEGKKAQPISVVVGRYEFDYSDTHASLLGRMGKISERLNAPFLTGISPRLLADKFKLKDEDLLATWDEMRELPSSRYVGVASPGFLLRLPYGENGRSTENVEFEEFDPENASGSLLWGNGGTFCAALIAGAFLKEGKWEFDPNGHRVLDKMPLFVSRDEDDEPTAVSTEVEFVLKKASAAGRLGVIPLQPVKKSDSVQVAELRSLSSADGGLGGAWGGASAATAPAAEDSASAPAPSADADNAGETESDALDPELAALLGGDDDSSDDGGLDPELAALLGDDDSSDDGGLDPELAALLGDDDGSSDSGDDDDDLDPELKALLGD